MAIEITGAHPPEHRFTPGDVIMVHRQLRDKETRKPFVWRYLALVTKVGRRADIAIQHIILDEKEREPTTLYLSMVDVQSGDGRLVRLWFLPEAEWPDGVYAFRTKLILEGRIELDL